MHGAQAGPPQSTSLSAPFFSWSMQVAGTHWPAPQFRLRQSPPVAHAAPSPHLLAQLPPQSLSVSPPFFTPSEQDATWQAPLLHTPWSQSVATLQDLPAVHDAQ